MIRNSSKSSINNSNNNSLSQSKKSLFGNFNINIKNPFEKY